MSYFSDHFGLYSVDFNNDEKARTIKTSGEFFKKVITSKCLRDDGCDVESNDTRM